MQLRSTMCLTVATGLTWLGTTQSIEAQDPVFVNAPGCQNGNCATGGGNPASFGPNKHLPNGSKPKCATHEYPKFESLYIKKFCGPNLIPGSNYGHFPTTWRRWDDSATAGGNCNGGLPNDPTIFATPYGEPQMTTPQVPMTTPLPNPTPVPTPTPVPAPMPMPMATTPTTPIPVPMPMPTIPKPKLDTPPVPKPKLESAEPLPGNVSVPSTLPQVAPIVIPPVIPVAPAIPVTPDKPTIGPGSTMAPAIPEAPPQTMPIGYPTSNSRPGIMSDPLQVKPWVNTKPSVTYPPTPNR